jgi:LysR family glycine cleavage system transcriptional activator
MAAMTGQGVALVNPYFFAGDLAAGRLVQLFDVVVQADRSYWLVYPKARRRSAKIRAFRDWALEEAARDEAERQQSLGAGAALPGRVGA